MILEQPAQSDYDFHDSMKMDVDNKGFTKAEMEILAGSQRTIPDAKGIDDFWRKIWNPNREVPPEIGNLKSDFGYQTRPLLTNLIDVANIQKTPLEGQIIALSSNYNFFTMRCGVFILPGNGEKFEALKFEVWFEDDNVSTYTMLPGPQTKKILEMGGKADIGITGKADFGFPDISVQSAKISGSAKAELDADFIMSFQYELKTQLVDSFGIGTNFCKWMMYKGDNLRNDVVFYPIIIAPKSITNFNCKFNAYFKIDHPDWKHPEFFLKPSRSIVISV